MKTQGSELRNRSAGSAASEASAAGTPSAAWRQRENRLLAIVLLLALVHGLIYVAIMPPWEHYEEPTHFEYAWLISSRAALPQFPAYDQDKRREIAASMVEHGFFRTRNMVPNLDSGDEPIWIGFNVSGALPLYHIAIALPLRLLAGANVDVQLYAARLASLLLYFLTIWIAGMVARELAPPGHALRYALPAIIALIPGFADLMTAVNNDVGATFVFSLFVWAALRLLLRGFTARRCLATLAAAAVCAFTKSTVVVALPLAMLAIGFALCPPRRRGMMGAGILAAALCAGAVTLSWGDAALWYRGKTLAGASQADWPTAPVGARVIALQATPGKASVGSQQPLLADEVARLRGKTVTLGAWIWSDTPARLPLLALSIDGQSAAQWQVAVGLEPAFYAGRWVIPDNASRVTVILPADTIRGAAKPVAVYYDGIVLLEGDWPGEAPPVFADGQGQRGYWGGREFVNPIRNASGEDTWPFVRPWLEDLFGRFSWSAHFSPELLLAAFLDRQYTGWIYSQTAWRLLTTFWGSFGWGGIALPSVAYSGLALVVALGFLAAAVGAARRYSRWPPPRQNAFLWLALAGLVVWGLVMLRGLFSTLEGRPYIPTARYGYPVIIPTVLALAAGWRWLLPGRQWLSAALITTALLILDAASVITVLNFYRGA